MLTIRRILHPTDFSDLSRPAFELACSLARDFGARLVVCHITPPPVAAVVEGMVVDVPAGESEQTRTRLEQVKPTDTSIKVVHRLEVGDAVREIVRLADEEKADLIVMGTHGRGGVSRLLMGSVAEGVMRRAPCPVLTLKAPVTVEQPRPALGKQLVTV